MDHRPALGNILWPPTIRLRTVTSLQERLFQRINPSTVRESKQGQSEFNQETSSHKVNGKTLEKIETEENLIFVTNLSIQFQI